MNKLLLGSDNATHTIEVKNDINMNGKQRAFDVRNGQAMVDALLSGKLINGGMSKSGAGTLQLSGANTYTGATDIKEGKVVVSSTGSLDSAVTIQKDASFVYAGNTSYTKTVTNMGGVFRYDSTAPFQGSFSGPSGFMYGTLTGTGNFSETILYVGNGAILAPGPEDVGQLTAKGLVFQQGGTYLWEINSLTGSAGASIGWDLLISNTNLNIGADGYNPFFIKIDSLGALDLWNPYQNYSWKIVDTQTGVTWMNQATLNSLFRFDTTSFADENALSGGFGLSVSSGDLMLNYTTTAIPEPSTWVMILILSGLILRRAKNIHFKNRRNSC